MSATRFVVLPPMPAIKMSVRVREVLIGVLVCWWAFAFLFANPDFANDDFDQLSKARQVLSGELPERDFYDDGRPLTVYISAAVQWFSPTLLSALTVEAGAIAIGVAIVYVLAYRLSGSTLLGLLSALFTMAMRPRLYNYPKVLVFPLGLWLLWRYVDHPTRGRLIQLGVLTVVASLFRYDYGMYLGVACVFVLIAVHRARVLPALAAYATVAVVCGAPYLVWLAANGRLVAAGSSGISTMIARMPGIVRVPVHLDLSDGLFELGPPRVQVGIRWAVGVDGDTRGDLERRYGLRPMGSKPDGRSVRYIMNDASPDRVLTMLHDPRVEDTSGIDRGSGRALNEPVRASWSALPRLRLTVFPTRDDAAGWIYYLFVLSVPAALLALWLAPDERVVHGAVKVGSLALLCAVLHQFLILGVLDTRLPEVTGPTAVLLSWLVGRGLDAGRSMAGTWLWIGRAVKGSSLVVLGSLTWLSVAVYADTSLERVVTAGIVRPAVLADVARRLGAKPLDYWTNERSTGVPALTRYVAQCLAPDDRLLMVSYTPEVFYFSERLFAGGVNSYNSNGFNPTSAQILKHLRRQSVPIVIVDEGSREAFQQDWSDVAHYVASRYHEVSVTGFGDERHAFHVLVDSRRAAIGTERRWNLPCFSDGRPGAGPR